MSETESDQSQEDLLATAEAVIEDYNLREGLGDRALILPDPESRAPALPFGAVSPVIDKGWADNATIAQVIARARQRDEIFCRGAKPPALVLKKDRHNNVGYGYDGDPELLTVMRNKRKYWYVVSGEAHPAGGRVQLDRCDTYTDAMASAWREARRFPPAVFMGRVLSMHEDLATVDWSVFKDHPVSDAPPSD